ncbi:MAG: hypothetical protein IPK07_13345 [Deltaproteobacteria bacterium]|nr:hypothetical protein [Deltaproteobacteria bacterium]
MLENAPANTDRSPAASLGGGTGRGGPWTVARMIAALLGAIGSFAPAIGCHVSEPGLG